MSSSAKKEEGDVQTKLGPIKYSKGVAENAYREVIHTSPTKVEKLKGLVNDGRSNGYELNIEVKVLSDYFE